MTDSQFSATAARRQRPQPTPTEPFALTPPAKQHTTPTPKPAGWRERIAPSIYRNHSARCPHAISRTPSTKRCCPWSIAVPGSRRGATTTKKLPASMPLSRVKRELKRHQADGRPRETPAAEAPAIPPLWKHVDEALRSKTNIRAITRDGYVHTYKRHIHERFGAVPVDQIIRKDVEIWAAEMSRSGLAPATVAGIVRVLRMVLNIAVNWDLIAKNPAAGIRLPKPDAKKAAALKVLTPGQVHTLLNHTDNTLRVETMLRAAAQAGLRRSELCGLRWGDIDWDRRIIHVQRGYNDGPTKSGRSRDVPINGHFIARLCAWREESIAVESNPDEGHVWPGKDGGEMHPHTPTQAHSRAMERAGLVYESASTIDTPRKGRRKRTTPRPLVTLHGLRHTFVSTLLANGGKLIDVSRVAGHADPAITAKVYAHLLHDDQVAYLADLFDEPEAAAA